MAAFVLGQEGGEHVRVDVEAKERPLATDSDDGNWVIARVSVAAGPWKGGYRASLLTEDFERFRDELEALYEDPAADAAHFMSLEPWLRLSVARTDRLGHVKVTGEARQEPFFEGHNVLFLTLEIDQSFLPVAIAGLDAIVEAFPVIR